MSDHLTIPIGPFEVQLPLPDLPPLPAPTDPTPGTCPVCHGSGIVLDDDLVDDPCPTCGDALPPTRDGPETA